MTKKRSYSFIYSNNTKKEEYEARKNFTKSLMKTIFKND